MARESDYYHGLLGKEIADSLKDCLERQNTVAVDVFSSEIFDLKRLYGIMSGGGDSRLSFPITLRNWGMTDQTPKAYYGNILLADVALWAQHGRALFDKNLRYYRATDINTAIEATLERSPEKFWYFNNGLTILCTSIDPMIGGGSLTDYKSFNCKGVSIVNGAPTVGSIWELARRREEYVSKLTNCIQARMISLKDCPKDFGKEITVATNTQNAIRHRDFAATDPEQHRLAEEMSLDRLKYVFKTGDPDPKPEEGCTIEDAAIALACSHRDISYAVQAKREVGLLWRDTTKEPYTILFNQKLTSPAMWRAVLVMRAVEFALDAAEKHDVFKGDAIAIHGNRFITHMVFNGPEVVDYRNPAVPIHEVADAASIAARRLLRETAECVKEYYPRDYIATLFKNNQKNEFMEDALLNPESTSKGRNMELFPKEHPE